MGWGNIGLSWTRYAKSTPTRNCARCHLDYAEEEDRCPHCGSIEDHELQDYLHALEEKKKRKNRIIGVFLASLLLYVFIVLFVLPTYLR